MKRTQERMVKERKGLREVGGRGGGSSMGSKEEVVASALGEGLQVRRT